MKVVKLAIFSFVFLFTIVWLISLLIPSEVRVSRATDIRADRDSVLAMIKDVDRWKEWYPNLDSFDSVKPIYKDGKLAGIILDDKNPDKPVILQLQSAKADEVTAFFQGQRIKPVLNTWKVMEHQDKGLITLQWTMDFKLRWYPWEKFASLVLEKSNGQRMEIGLANIKKRLSTDLSSNN
ncbi:SRPBCC family protein [Terrimonas sp. NA20]|uniref:SRPBCC family protein n=1 Tax=Terrimonas ginsenosidimutans TaxID=2908004 RepID=A0ABS9L0V7_9BACT|nr:SRPBCC family protein [Terrimonas ginsenosidimutans]MCG2618213.1 SRPBCC family protein [Terrimonas ginsenosidimutans]